MPKTGEEKQKHLNQLVNNCLYYADRNGRVLEKFSNRVSAQLAIEYRDPNGTYIVFRVYESGYSNGSCRIEVRQGETVVLEAKGNYMAGAFNMEAETYQSGDWEKNIPEWKRK